MLHCAYCSAQFVSRCVVMDGIVDSVLSSYGLEISGPTKEKLLGYIQLLASTGQTDEQLVTFGSAYLHEISAPDPATRAGEARPPKLSGFHHVIIFF
jgi:hypothetical protein